MSLMSVKCPKMEVSTMRPNIRIEIQNNLVESMEIDDEAKRDEGEEGEICDTNDVEDSTAAKQNQTIIRPVPSQRIWPNTNGGFTTGINIFDKEEQTKLVERAKRFALKPDEVHNFSDGQLQELHDSLGITTDDEKDVRFEALHMRGTDEMSTDDVLEYFRSYGPAGIEWINDESCNVVWNDKVSAARALFFLSKQIKGMPVEGPRDPFMKELADGRSDDKENASRSVLLKNNNREVELKDDNDVEEIMVNVCDITVPIPPGYWRLGVEHAKAKFILIRFAFKSDKKPLKAEKFSEYYKKHGNPNFGGLKGYITETCKKKIKGIFDRNRDMPDEAESNEDPKNPWGVLAKNWNSDAQYCEKIILNNAIKQPVVEKSNIMSRLGFKRSLNSEDESKDETADVPAGKKTKIPRMRMYADEEEEKIKRKRQLQQVKMGAGEPKGDANDLRNVLKVLPRKAANDELEAYELQSDLGAKLKNRVRRLNEAATQMLHNYDAEDLKQELDLKRRKDDERDERERSRDRFRRKSPPNHRVSRQEKTREFNDEKWSHKPRSKIAVVIKTQKKPAVASTVWSRINSERERHKTVSEGKLRVRRDSTSSDSESSSTSASSSVGSSSEDESDVADRCEVLNVEKLERPGFKNELKSIDFNPTQHRSPLRIEISNDHFKKE